ncbi:hypothetical protein [Hymenobacter cellulosilyticus]|uniref:Uncharacterized protein n=1 Tax=Hymenobacter cellulosilyticus TaxID=2932248 RepID=A0A8T9Q712_9BACT|nr:hypothetical protein [Hymenobacter cellulosilyticus]UOQ72915.1 hypothetical protein MUN79_02705 [Hymenobacter cellulosilyticus]
MNRFLSSAFFFVVLSAASAQAQTQTKSTSAAATDWSQPELDPWTINAPTKEEAAPATTTTATTNEAISYNTGWSSAPASA